MKTDKTDSGSIFSKAKKYALYMLKDAEHKGLYYHNFKHALLVSNAARKLCKMEKIPEHETELVVIAAIYHDLGYIIRYENNEPFGAIIAHIALKAAGYSDEEIETVSNLILSTSMPQRPRNRLEQILCDADLSALGTAQYFSYSDRLRRERGISMGEWNRSTIRFLKVHKYFTHSARAVYEHTKEMNMQKMKDRANRKA